MSEARLGPLISKAFPNLPEETVSELVAYYELVLKWNRKISLTTITSPREFAERHLGEALFAVDHIGAGVTEVWDIGSGLGIPGIPIAIVRPALAVKLVESNRKKAIFLEEACDALRLRNATVLRARLETLPAFSERACVTLRAVERMEKLTAHVFKKAESSQVLVFGGDTLHVGWPTRRKLSQYLLPGSTARFLYSVT